jgi:hypothetical protein
MSATNLKYKDVYFDSDEEVYMAMWLQELKEAGFVAQWKKVKDPIILTVGKKIPYVKVTQLKTKVKKEQKEHILLNGSEYTPDFEIHWTHDGILKFLFGIYNEREEKSPKESLFFTTGFNETIVEVKPSFDQQNMERLFKNNQKFIWDKHKIFVNLIEPIELFRKTFVPYAAMPYLVYRKKPTSAKNKHKNVGDFKYDFQPITINEYLCSPSSEK